MSNASKVLITLEKIYYKRVRQIEEYTKYMKEKLFEVNILFQIFLFFKE